MVAQLQVVVGRHRLLCQEAMRIRITFAHDKLNFKVLFKGQFSTGEKDTEQKKDLLFFLGDFFSSKILE